MLGPGAAVLHQRFVLSGLIDEQGNDLGRIGALLFAVLVAKPDGWRAVSLQFTAITGLTCQQCAGRFACGFGYRVARQHAADFLDPRGGIERRDG